MTILNIVAFEKQLYIFHFLLCTDLISDFQKKEIIIIIIISTAFFVA